MDSCPSPQLVRHACRFTGWAPRSRFRHTCKALGWFLLDSLGPAAFRYEARRQKHSPHPLSHAFLGCSRGSNKVTDGLESGVLGGSILPFGATVYQRVADYRSVTG